ncbi:MAG TPA: ABC transporter ATP-binding protein [Thermodesulfobacteriota bacterium]
MLKIDNLVKDYTSGFLRKKVRVLQDVSFSVNRGEIFGFVGPNGAGKTTTFKVILGFVSITGGRVELMGEPLGDVEVKRKIGYLPENPYFYDYLTGEELLHYMGELHGVNGDRLSRRADYLLEKVKMTHARKIQLRKYSKGMLQRVGIAQALINDPEFLILDEPMSGLDPIGQREIRELILEQKELGKTILMSSHILSDVEALCERVAIIINGKVVKIGELGKLFEDMHSIYEMLLRVEDETVLDYLSDLNVTIEKRAGLIVLKFDEGIKSRVLEVLSGSGVDIIALHPLRKSLEGLFVEEAKKDGHVES